MLLLIHCIAQVDTCVNSDLCTCECRSGGLLPLAGLNV
jgi:hypothetical protein